MQYLETETLQRIVDHQLYDAYTQVQARMELAKRARQSNYVGITRELQELL